MSSKLDRFKKRQNLKKRLHQEKHLFVVADEELVAKHLNSKVDRELISKTKTEDISLTKVDYS